MVLNKILLFFVLIYPSLMYSQDAKPGVETAMECGQATKTQPRSGVAYTGRVTNEDYDFSARIPFGLTAWGGVARDAPFHGFTVFLDPTMKSCIVFEVHLRVDEEDAPLQASGAAPLRLGKAQGWQTTEKGIVHGVGVTKVKTTFTFARPGRTDDGEILLISETSKLGEAKRTYDDFLRSLSFGR